MLDLIHFGNLNSKYQLMVSKLILLKFRFAKMIATWFGVGLSKFAPGTCGSLAALPLAWVIFEFGNSSGLIIAVITTLLIGIWATNCYCETIEDKDPPQVVVDEVAGQILAVAFIPASISNYLIGFIIFRFFDIFKPWPIRWIDENIKGGVGVMMDDILAGIFSAAILCLIMNFEY